jgi:hypothetical protein
MGRAAGGIADDVDEERQAPAVVSVWRVDDDLPRGGVAEPVMPEDFGPVGKPVQFAGRDIETRTHERLRSGLGTQAQ